MLTDCDGKEIQSPCIIYLDAVDAGAKESVLVFAAVEKSTKIERADDEGTSTRG
jgi:hypothetical protein